MKIGNKILSSLSAAFVFGAISGCAYHSHDRVKTMLLDDNATRITSGVIQLRERPLFPVDGNQRPYALLEESDDKFGLADKTRKAGAPFAIQERQAMP